MGCGYIELWVYTGLPSLGLWEAGAFAATGRPARVRCGTQARQAVWLAMCVGITAVVQGNHGMVAQARRHLDPCVSVKRSANTSGTYENGATSRREYREARVLARIARALARYGRRVRWASLPAEQRVVGLRVLLVIAAVTRGKLLSIHFGYELQLKSCYGTTRSYGTTRDINTYRHGNCTTKHSAS